MRRTRSFVAAAAVGLCCPIALQAEEVSSGASGLYLDVYGGIDWIGDNAIDTAQDEGQPVLQTFFLDYDEGAVAGLRLGWRYSAVLRADAELAFRQSAIDDLSSPEGSITPGFSFDFETAALMVNGYRDIPMRGITPYIGAGIGVASVKTAGSIAPGDPGFDYSRRQTAPAAQLRIGAVVPLSDRVDIGAEYTHFRAFGIGDNLSADFFDSLREDYESDSVAVLVRVRF